MNFDVEATIADDEMHNLKWRFFANVANDIVCTFHQQFELHTPNT
jgi:hypothetical protein